MPKEKHGLGVQYFVWTYNTFDWSIEDGKLTVTGTGDIADYANASDVPWNGYIGSIDSVVIGEGITGIGTNVLAGLYDKKVSLPKTLTSFDNISDYESTALTLDSADPMNGTFEAPATKLSTLGVQEKIVDNANAFRFVTVADSGLLNAADDYGYIAVKVPEGKDKDYALNSIDELVVTEVPSASKFSCKGSSNSFAGAYGTADLTTTDYKYISLIVTGAGSGQVVACRFYVTLDGTTYTYSTYDGYGGCAYALS